MEWVLLSLVVLVLLGTIVVYNRLVKARNQYRNAFAQIDVQLTRRYDLIPNLVKTAERYMSHERDTLEAVIEARNQASNQLKNASADPGDPQAMKGLGQAESGLSGALGRLFALSESYPDLKANENMKQLSEELTSTENRVAYARQHYNDSVMKYNNLREIFPNNLVAGMFNFDARQMLEIEDEAKREPVELNFKQ